MRALRATWRLCALALWTPVCYLAWLLTRPLRFVSDGAALKTHHACVGTWARGCTAILGIRVEVQGEAPGPPFFLVANHLSYVDILVLHSCLECVFLAKSEVGSWPVIGFLARSTGTLFVDRGRKSDLVRVIDETHRRMARGFGVVVFPEGTSTDGSGVQPFKTSLFKVPASVGHAVHCASVSYATRPAAPPANMTICWWGDMTFGKHFLNLITLPPFRALVSFAPEPIVATDRKVLALESQRAVEAIFTPVS